MFPPIALPPFNSKKQAVSDGVYLKYPGILGSAKGTYAGWLEVDAISWGTSDAHRTADDLFITRRRDKNSPRIIRDMDEGKLLREIIVEVVDSGQTIKITGSDVVVNSYEFGESWRNSEVFTLHAREWSISSKV